MITINNQGPFNTGRDPDVIVGDPRAVDPGETLFRFSLSSHNLNLCHCGNVTLLILFTREFSNNLNIKPGSLVSL